MQRPKFTRYLTANLCIHGFLSSLIQLLTMASVIVSITMSLTPKIIKEPEAERWFVEGQSVMQTCVFDVPVFCAWHKNGTHIKISNRYMYTNPKQQGKTDDCSIKISILSAEDKGWWSCCNMEDSNGIEVVHSNKTWLGIQEMKIDIQPRNYSRVNRGSNVTLDCKFNTKVKCSWRKNGNVIEKGFRYMDKNNQHTDNCSILLINVGKAQAGKWECQNMVNDKINKTVSSLPVEITVENPVVVIHPQSQTLKELYKTVYLNCTFNMPVNCSWKFESNVAHIKAPINNNKINYTNSDGIATKDCSITISNLRLSNIGNWTCADKLDKAIVSQNATLHLVKQPTTVACDCSSNCAAPFTCKVSNGKTDKNAQMQLEEIRCLSIDAFPPPSMYWQIDNAMASYKQPSIILYDTISKNLTVDGFWNSTLSMSIETYDQLNTCFNNYSLTCVVVHAGYENEKNTLKVGNINQCSQVNVHVTRIDEDGSIVNQSFPQNTSAVGTKNETTCTSCSVCIAFTVIFGLLIIVMLAIYCYKKQNYRLFCTQKKNVGNSDEKKRMSVADDPL